MLTQYAKKNHFPNIEYYVDDGYSGTNFERPDFQRLMNDIKDGKVGIVITKDLSRLGRNYIETGNFIEVIFPGMGVSVISVDENCEFDSSDYFDLTIEENEHYKELVDYYNIGNEQFYRAMIAVAIGSSDCENKNVNEVVYGVVSNISKNINNLTRKYA